jgi:DNA-binding IclR family transcriptional regulator
MYNAPIIKKAIEILRLLVKEYQPLGVTEIAKDLSISKSTAYGILQSFQEEGLVSKDSTTKKYTIGKEMMKLSKMVFKGQDIATITRPFLERLAELVNETVFLGVKEYDSVKIIYVIEAKKDFKISSPIGTKLPISAGAIGKIFLSTMSNEEVVEFLRDKGLPQYTENSITDINLFIEEIEKTRDLGYSIDLGEYLKGVWAAASLIYQDASPVGAIWFVGFSNSMIDERLHYIINNLKNTAKQISTRLSFNPLSEKDQERRD